MKCHDCQKEMKIQGKEIKNGVLAVYKEGDQELKVFKCKTCFGKNPELRNYQDCEVYSRIVGYLRPVKQWHIGKKQEFEERKEYKIS